MESSGEEEAIRRLLEKGERDVPAKVCRSKDVT